MGILILIHLCLDDVEYLHLIHWIISLPFCYFYTNLLSDLVLLINGSNCYLYKKEIQNNHKYIHSNTSLSHLYIHPNTHKHLYNYLFHIYMCTHIPTQSLKAVGYFIRSVLSHSYIEYRRYVARSFFSNGHCSATFAVFY